MQDKECVLAFGMCEQLSNGWGKYGRFMAHREEPGA